MITYREKRLVNSTVTHVFLDGTHVGTIRPNGPGLWHYTPKGTNTPGDSMPSVAAVKRSLENDTWLNGN